MKKTIFYATTNTGKFEEVKRYLSEHEHSHKYLIDLKQLDKDFPEIQTMDQEAIAINKAEQAWNYIKQPVIVDDSGIYFEHYNLFPGTLSKFIFHSIGFEGILKLTEDDNRAKFLVSMVYKNSENTHAVFQGDCKGTIVRPESFECHTKQPYDAIFVPVGTNKTMGQIRKTKEEKDYASRLRALKKFLDWFKESKN